MKVLVLHGYSAANLGDGLLVEETLRLIRDALGEDVKVTLAASHPETFNNIDAKVVSSALTPKGYDNEYLRLLLRASDYDLIIAVGGGYLRFGTPIEAIKTSLIHGPQLLAAAFARTPVVYLSQSIGPIKFGSKTLIRALLRRLNYVFLRDDRSIAEVGNVGVAHRLPDLALISGSQIRPSGEEPLKTPILSVRSLRGETPPLTLDLARRLEGNFETYIQSTTSGNDDRQATAAIGGLGVLTRSQLLDSARPRVVVAVRLHAALMALRAGHYVVHLSYERKGFGAFQDLGISEYVHNVNSFSVEEVLGQIHSLLHEAEVRAAYAASIQTSQMARKHARDGLITSIRGLVGKAGGI